MPIAVGALLLAGAGMAAATLVFPPLGAITEPLAERARLWAWQRMPWRELSAAQLTELFYRKKLDKEEYVKRMKALGYDEEKINEILATTSRLLEAGDLLVAKWRGIIEEEEFKEYMQKLGFSDADIERYELVRKYYPSPTDFIRFAVREVFNDEIVKKYGYDEEFPEGIVPYAEKQGMDRDTLLWYWRAHWELPSPTQGYYMLHRLNPYVLRVLGDKYRKMGLNPQELEVKLFSNTPQDISIDELLRTADYPAPWRKRLIAISYNPLTRVDLRRLYVLGLIDDEELVARLMETGYTRDDAELLAQFYKLYKTEQERDLTKSEILNAYEAKLVTRGEAKKRLMDIGYDEGEAEFILTLKDYEVYRKALDARIKAITEQYVKGLLDDDKFKDKLRKIEGIREVQVDMYLERAKAEKEKRVKLPSRTDLMIWRKLGLIDDNEFIQRMMRIGYTKEDSEKYLEVVKRGV